MLCRIAARKSHLARLQALTVGRALQALRPDFKIEYEFRESLGDKNAQDPLWKMPEKGVFTQDFVDDLVNGRCDMVVHSWKDLPLDRPPNTRLAATMPRADSRDLLLVARDKWQALLESRGPRRATILTSSPRRSYNLGAFLKEALPGNLDGVEFWPVRGNIPTRLRKLLSEPAHGLVVAKAALDRLLAAHADPEFRETADEIRSVLAACRWMALPLSVNPPAAAQGALAIEVSDKTPREILEALAELNCPETFMAVEEERRVLSSYGGGCHQKIGVSVLERPYGRVSFLRGLTDAGVVLDEAKLIAKNEAHYPLPASKDKMFPADQAEASFFDREGMTVTRPEAATAWWVARADAWPESWTARESDLVWAAGLETWRKLAARGVWVNGSSEGLGEREAAQVDTIVGRAVHWTKLSHDEGVRPESDTMGFLPTYRLKPRAFDAKRFEGRTHFYWKSASSFERALALAPEAVRAGWHFCGPGHTAAALEKHFGPQGRWSIVLDREDWLAKMGQVEKV